MSPLVPLGTWGLRQMQERRPSLPMAPGAAPPVPWVPRAVGWARPGGADGEAQGAGTGGGPGDGGCLWPGASVVGGPPSKALLSPTWSQTRGPGVPGHLRADPWPCPCSMPRPCGTSGGSCWLSCPQARVGTLRSVFGQHPSVTDSLSEPSRGHVEVTLRVAEPSGLCHTLCPGNPGVGVTDAGSARTGHSGAP